MAKMSKKWVVLCSTAVAAVYAAGYFTTETQASVEQTPKLVQASITAQAAAGTSNAVKPTASPSIAVQATVSPSKTVQPTVTPSKAVQAAKRLYNDGTYTGSARNRFGTIQVSVTIKSDKITDVEISHFTMSYPKSDIEGLPDEVLHKQSAEVANVSGATYSTRAFKEAVQAALSQGLNA